MKSNDTAADRRARAAAEALCDAVERRMDELVRLLEEEIAVVRRGRLFALKPLEARKAKAAKDFISGLETVKKIRPALERAAPDAVLRLRVRHNEFRSTMQLNMAALETAKAAADTRVRTTGERRGLPVDEEASYPPPRRASR